MQFDSPQTSDTASGRRGWTRVWLAGLLAVHLMLLLWASASKSACYDEGPHVAAGLAYWREGETSIYNLSPPLMRYWVALPAYLAGADLPVAQRLRDLPAKTRGWAYFNDVQAANPGRIHRFVLWGRWVSLPLSLATAGLIFGWARSLSGEGAGLLACATWCFSPLALAQGSAVGTDVGCTLSMNLTLWLWLRFAARPSNDRAMGVAAAFAAAQTIKFTALLLVPLLMLLALWNVWRRQLRWKVAAIGLMLCAIVGYVGFNATYRFGLIGDSIGSFDFASKTMQRLQANLPAWLPVPLPRDAVRGFDVQKYEAETAYVTPMFDQAYFGSDWRFYPMQLAYCETVGFLVLLVLMLMSFALRRPAAGEWPILLAAVGVIGGFIALAKINISLRYLLPAYPLAAVLIGRLACVRGARWVALAAISLTIIELAPAAPRFNSFGNWIAGERRTWWIDVDGGQSLIAVRDWQRANPKRSATLLYAGTVNPGEYGVSDSHDDALERGSVVILSKLLLVGLPIRTPHGFTFLRCWRELRTQPPLADLDGMRIYSAEQVRQTQVVPWQRDVATWADYWTDPKGVPFIGRGN